MNKNLIFKHEIQNLAITEEILMRTYFPFSAGINEEHNFYPTCHMGVCRRPRGRDLKNFFARSTRVLKSSLSSPQIMSLMYGL